MAWWLEALLGNCKSLSSIPGRVWGFFLPNLSGRNCLIFVYVFASGPPRIELNLFHCSHEWQGACNVSLCIAMCSHGGCDFSRSSRIVSLYLFDGVVVEALLGNCKSLSSIPGRIWGFFLPNTEIVDSVSNDRKLKYLEAIYINVNKPPLNVQGINSIILPSDRQAQ